MIKFALPALAALSLAACADSTPEADATATDTATDTTMTEPMASDTAMAADPMATGTATDMAADPAATGTGTMTDGTMATPAPTATSTPM